MVTNEAITTIYTGIRTLSGTILFIADTATFEHMSTNRVARPIDIPVIADEVVPNVGHMPNMSTKVGFFFTIPSNIILNAFMALNFYWHKLRPHG